MREASQIPRVTQARRSLHHRYELHRLLSTKDSRKLKASGQKLSNFSPFEDPGNTFP